jgi:hypothetical protein
LGSGAGVGRAGALGFEAAVVGTGRPDRDGRRITRNRGPGSSDAPPLAAAARPASVGALGGGIRLTDAPGRRSCPQCMQKVAALERAIPQRGQATSFTVRG